MSVVPPPGIEGQDSTKSEPATLAFSMYFLAIAQLVMTFRYGISCVFIST